MPPKPTTCGRSTNRVVNFPRPRSLTPETFDEPSVLPSDTEDDAPPPALVSPIKRRRGRTQLVSINKKSDAEVWDLSDDQIIGVFTHLTLTLVHI